MAAAQELGTITRTRPRDRMREAIAELMASDEPAPLEQEDIPIFDAPSQRVWWIAQRIAAGLYRTSDIQKMADRWGLKPGYIKQNYCHNAAMLTQIVTSDAEKLKDLAAMKVSEIALGLGMAAPGDQLAAARTILQLTGHLKGGREDHLLGGPDLVQAITESIRCPNDEMMSMLRAAFSNPSDELRALLAEFAVVEVAGQ